MPLPNLLVLQFRHNNKKKVGIVGLVFSVLIIMFFLQPVMAIDLPGLEKTAQTANIARPGVSPLVAVTNIVQWVLSFVGVLFLILMIYGGFTWMTSVGNQEAISKAQKIVGSAVIGLIIVLSAYAITVYMGTTFSGVQP